MEYTKPIGESLSRTFFEIQRRIDEGIDPLSQDQERKVHSRLNQIVTVQRVVRHVLRRKAYNRSGETGTYDQYIRLQQRHKAIKKPSKSDLQAHV